MPNIWAEQLSGDDLVLESLPEDVEETMRARDAWLRNLPPSEGLEFVVSDLSRWNPGQRVRVAFNGGDKALHRDIAEATGEITSNCNLSLDFGIDPQTGACRTWSTQDASYAADIRVTFDKPGFFSLVGTDSINPNIGSPIGAVGGRPGQCSLNLGGFTVNRPQNWPGVVRHEFLHALSFHHAHQNMRGPCEQAFRWDDDAGYQPTRDARGQFVVDAAGRRPGIYTYLSGFPNFWNKQKVDHNLRTTEDPSVVVGPFDRQSVMLYRFPALFYKTTPSQCAPVGEGIILSEGDRRGLQLLYPGSATEVSDVMDRRTALLETVEKTMDTSLDGLEEAGSGARAFAESAATLLNLLRRRLAEEP